MRLKLFMKFSFNVQPQRINPILNKPKSLEMSWIHHKQKSRKFPFFYLDDKAVYILTVYFRYQVFRESDIKKCNSMLWSLLLKRYMVLQLYQVSPHVYPGRTSGCKIVIFVDLDLKFVSRRSWKDGFIVCHPDFVLSLWLIQTWLANCSSRKTDTITGAIFTWAAHNNFLTT